MNEKTKLWLNDHWLAFIVGCIALVIALVAIRVHIRFWSLDTVGSDTYYSWVEGDRILRGRNPYARILNGNMDDNKKYATYLPLFYEASAVTQYLGLEYYPKWIAFWRYIFIICNISIGLTLFAILYSRRTWAISLLALLFWYFNRWTLNASMTVALDLIPIFFMILSLALFNKYRKVSYLLYGLSLAIKQIAIFLLPLYLIWEFQQSRSIKKTILAGLWIVSIPLIASIPFLFWNAEGFFKSIIFSATRAAQNHFDADSIDTILGLRGLPARIFFLFLLFLAYLTSWQRSVGRYGGAMLVMSVFIAFNSVLFMHYPAWLMALIPLAVCERLNSENFIRVEM